MPSRIERVPLPTPDVVRLLEFPSSFFGGVAQAGTAALFAHVELGNPLNSDRLLIVMGLVVGATANNRCQIRSDTHDQANQATVARNVVLGEATPMGNIIAAQLGAHAGTLVQEFPLLANQSYPIIPPRPWVLYPGRALTLENGVLAAVTLFFNFFWDEVRWDMLPMWLKEHESQKPPEKEQGQKSSHKVKGER